MIMNLRHGTALASVALFALLALDGPGTGAIAQRASGGPAAVRSAAVRSAAVPAPAGHVQRRQVAATELSRFKVVLTATRVSRLDATVTASGYRQTAHGWSLIATQRIGKAGSWSWFATDVCSLKVTQYRPIPSSARPADSITVSLLWGPAIGCLGPYTKRWRP